MRLTVPHSLTLAPDKQLLFLADREHGRIVCFNFEGATQYVIEYGQFGSRVFAVDYCPSHGEFASFFVCVTEIAVIIC